MNDMLMLLIILLLLLILISTLGGSISVGPSHLPERFSAPAQSKTKRHAKVSSKQASSSQPSSHPKLVYKQAQLLPKIERFAESAVPKAAAAVVQDDDSSSVPEPMTLGGEFALF